MFKNLEKYQLISKCKKISQISMLCHQKQPLSEVRAIKHCHFGKMCFKKSDICAANHALKTNEIASFILQKSSVGQIQSEFVGEKVKTSLYGVT